MKIRDVMTTPAINIHPEETVEVAARTLTQHNIGALPVCDNQGKICGMVTDRDLVIRCVASNRNPARTTVREVMTGQVLSVQADMETGAAAHLMGRQQVRRLPVTEGGLLCGMVSLGDLACTEENAMDAADALTEITSNISQRKGW